MVGFSSDFIKATGIQKLREAVEEREKMKKTKQKMRDRVNPKIGRMDIDYSVMEAAFLR